MVVRCQPTTSSASWPTDEGPARVRRRKELGQVRLVPYQKNAFPAFGGKAPHERGSFASRREFTTDLDGSSARPQLGLDSDDFGGLHRADQRTRDYLRGALVRVQERLGHQPHAFPPRWRAPAVAAQTPAP